MKFPTPEEVVTNFIAWHISDADELKRLISSVNDPMIAYQELDQDDLEQDEYRIQNNIDNVMRWVSRQNYPIVYFLKTLRTVADYFEESTQNGLESVSTYSSF